MKSVDVAIIGAGPAGLAAGAVTGRAGLQTLILDEQARPGGQIWRSAEDVLADPARAALFAGSFDGAAASIEAVRKMASLQSAADLLDISPQRELLWLDRTRGRLVETTARAIIVASGAMERPVPLPGWTLPGVMGVGALQIAMKQSFMVPEGPIVVAGQGPLLLLVLRQLRALGASIAAVLDIGGPLGSREAVGALPSALAGDPSLVRQGLSLLAGRTLSRVPLYRRVRQVEALGDTQLEAVAFEAGGTRHEIPARLLALHDGVIPNTQISRLLNLHHTFRPAQEAFAPVVGEDGTSAVEGIFVAGDAAGIGGAQLARVRGAAAGEAVCRALGVRADAQSPAKARRLGSGRRFVDALYRPLPVEALATEATIVCRCERVTLGAIRAAVAAGASGPNRVKTATRCGMGPCQGRICGNPLTRLVAAFTGRPAAEVGALRIRPPLKPVLLADYAALHDQDAGP